MWIVRASRPRPRPAEILLLACLMILPLAAVAQDPEPETAVEAISTATEQEVGKRGAEIMGRLDRAIRDYNRYSELMTAASAEDSLVYRIQMVKE